MFDLARFLVVTIIAFHSVDGQLNCSTLADGNYQIGCKSYGHCENGEHTIVECGSGMVYNKATDVCDYQTNVPPPCGLIRDCSPPVNDGAYADKSLNCTSYYTCHFHTYFGHNYCTPGTVFEETLATCVWPADAYPPCGTKV